MPNTLYESECAQVDALIDIKKQEIKDLEELKDSWSEDSWDDQPSSTPAQVAQDPNASSEERAAAANNVIGQSPETVNAEQSHPSPSTHDSAKELNEQRYQALHADLNDEAQKGDKDEDKDLHAYDNGLPVEGADGREDANKLGEAGQVEEGGTPGGGSQTVEAGTFDQEEKGGPVVDTRNEEKDSGADKQAKSDSDTTEKQKETNQNLASIGTSGKTDSADKEDKAKSTSTTKASSTKKADSKGK